MYMCVYMLIKEYIPVLVKKNNKKETSKIRQD